VQEDCQIYWFVPGVLRTGRVVLQVEPDKDEDLGNAGCGDPAMDSIPPHDDECAPLKQAVDERNALFSHLGRIQKQGSIALAQQVACGFIDDSSMLVGGQAHVPQLGTNVDIVCEARLALLGEDSVAMATRKHGGGIPFGITGRIFITM
jgi:hypothetical protein